MKGCTVPEVAQVTGMHSDTIRRNLVRGRIQGVRDLAGWWRIPRDEVKRLKRLYAGEEMNGRGELNGKA